MCGIIKKRVRRGSKLKDFLNFAFFRSNAGFKKCERQPNFRCFVHFFRNFCFNFDQFSLKYDKIVDDRLIGFTFEDRRELLHSLNQLFRQNFQHFS